MTKKTNIVRFNSIDLEVIKQNNDFYLTSTQIAEALEYSDRRAILKVYRNNKELLDEYSRVVKMDTFDGKNREVRIFNEEGVMLIAMKSNKPKAIEFQKWAVKVLKEYRYQTNNILEQKELQTTSINIIAIHGGLYVHSLDIAPLFNVDHECLLEQMRLINKIGKQYSASLSFDIGMRSQSRLGKNGRLLSREAFLMLDFGNDDQVIYRRLKVIKAFEDYGTSVFGELLIHTDNANTELRDLGYSISHFIEAASKYKLDFNKILKIDYSQLKIAINLLDKLYQQMHTIKKQLTTTRTGRPRKTEALTITADFILSFDLLINQLDSVNQILSLQAEQKKIFNDSFMGSVLKIQTSSEIVKQHSVQRDEYLRKLIGSLSLMGYHRRWTCDTKTQTNGILVEEVLDSIFKMD